MGSDYMPVPFDSRKIYYRSPFGAVEQGTEIHFRILLPKAEHTQKAHLCVKYDYDCNWEFTELIWCGKFDEDTEIWECDFTPKSDFIGITLSLLALIKQDMLFRPIRIRSAPLKTIWAEAGRLPATKKTLKLPAGLSAELCIRFFPTVFIAQVLQSITYPRTVICISGGGRNRNGGPIIREKSQTLIILAEIWKVSFKNWIIYKA